MKKKETHFLVESAIIAAAYAALTLVLSPLSYGVIQVRVSEALCVLAVFTPAAIPGLSIGCFISGILGPNGIVDALFGTFATFLGTLGTYALRRHKYIAPLVNVLSNAVIIGSMLYYIDAVEMPLVYCIVWVGVGELISCFGIGSLLTKYLSTHNQIFTHIE